jgi:hypothetical protein
MFLRICLVVCLALAAVNGRVAKPKPFLTQELIDEINAAQTTWKAGHQNSCYGQKNQLND